MNLFIKGEVWDRYAEIIAVEDMHLSEITPEYDLLKDNHPNLKEITYGIRLARLKTSN